MMTKKYQNNAQRGKLGMKPKKRSKKFHEFGMLVAKNMEAGLTPSQAVAAAKNGVWVQKE
jgi:hypothetical protein